MRKFSLISANHNVPATTGVYIPDDFAVTFFERTPYRIEHDGCANDDDLTSERVCESILFDHNQKNDPQFSEVHDWVAKDIYGSEIIYWTKNQVKDFFINNPALFSAEGEKQHWFFTKEKNGTVCASLVIHVFDTWRFAPYRIKPMYSHGVASGARIFCLK